MSFSETIFLFFLALIIFGPKKLPEIARTVGKALNEFRRASNEFKAQIEQEIAHLEVETKPTILPPSPTPDGTTSRTLSAAPIEAVVSEATATAAVAEDEPLFATAPGATVSGSTTVSAAAASTEAIPAPSEVTSARSQESHA